MVVINTKHQTPSSREVPESKHQKPRSKHQRNPKFQAPNRGPRFEFGTWSLELLWCLELGVWCLGPGASLELGVWNLELFAWALSFSKIAMRPLGKLDEAASCANQSQAKLHCFSLKAV